MNQPRFLITGATGFVGRHLLPALTARYGTDAIIAMTHSDLKPRDKEFLEQLKRQHVQVIQCDLLDLPSLSLPIPEFDVLYHLAAYVETEESSPKIKVNTQGTENLLNWLGKALHGKHLIYTGTLASVDRKGRPDGPMVESTPCFPRTKYGQTKLEAEDLIQKSRDGLGYDLTILRLCTILGHGFRSGGMFDVFPNLLRSNAIGARINWPGRTSLMSIGDLVHILLAVSETRAAKNQMFVLSNGEDPTFDELLQQIANTLGIARAGIVLPHWIWNLVGTVATLFARNNLLPHKIRTVCWRVSLMVYDGIYADSAKLNSLLNMRYQPITEALAQAYAGDIVQQKRHA